jgi:hypothetical protein
MSSVLQVGAELDIVV